MAYGIDWEGPIPEEIETLEEVHVPDIICPLQSLADLAENCLLLILCEKVTTMV